MSLDLASDFLELTVFIVFVLSENISFSLAIYNLPVIVRIR